MAFLRSLLSARVGSGAVTDWGVKLSCVGVAVGFASEEGAELAFLGSLTTPGLYSSPRGLCPPVKIT